MEEVNDLNNNMNEEQPAEPVQEQQKETEPALEIEKEPEQEPASEQGKQPERRTISLTKQLMRLL